MHTVNKDKVVARCQEDNKDIDVVWATLADDVLHDKVVIESYHHQRVPFPVTNHLPTNLPKVVVEVDAANDDSDDSADNDGTL